MKFHHDSLARCRRRTAGASFRLAACKGFGLRRGVLHSLVSRFAARFKHCRLQVAPASIFKLSAALKATADPESRPMAKTDRKDLAEATQ